MMRCRRWRRKQIIMLQKLKIRRTTAGGMQEQTHLKTMFGKAATTEVLRFIGITEAGKRLTDDTHKGDLWNAGLLDSRDEETMGNGRVWSETRRMTKTRT